VARIRAVLRRTGPARSASPIRIGETTVDLEGFRIERGGETFPITGTERGMLELLWRHRGRLVTRETFLREVWGYGRIPETRTVDFHIARLRRKLEDRPDRPRYLKTVRGRGYLLDPSG
jgi:DNA-binding response OmpR family regulator